MIIEAPKLKKAFIRKVEDIVGPDHCSAKNIDRLNYSRDSNFQSTILNYYKKAECFPDIIAWPQTARQVQQLVKAAIRHKIPIVPYGAGTGVCGGTVPVRGGMVIDIKRINHFIKLDESNLLVTVEAGMMLQHLEDELERRGYTLGHFPSSIICCSVGGCLAARSAGQKSTRFGKIEDMVTALEIVAGNGEIIATQDVRNGPGLDLNQLFVGSEGTLGVITQATLRVYPQAPSRAFQGLRFSNIAVGLEAIRRLIQAGIQPPVIRLYDELDTLFVLKRKKAGWHLPIPDFITNTVKKTVISQPRLLKLISQNIPTGCALVLVFEGHEKIIHYEKQTALQIATSLGARDLGEAPARNWYGHRYSVSYNVSRLFNAGLFTDTVEIATTWDRILPLYEGMVKKLGSQVMIMAHMSHAYPEGGAWYFTFVAPLTGAKSSVKLYDRVWQTALETADGLGGCISHHHGIGRLKIKFMEKEWGRGLEIFRSLKNKYDPQGIMNPGKLLEVA